MSVSWSVGTEFTLSVTCNKETQGSWKILLDGESVLNLDKVRVMLDTNPDKCGVLLESKDGGIQAFGPPGVMSIDFEGSGGLRVEGRLDSARIYYKGEQMGRVQSLDIQHRADSPLTMVNLRMAEIPARGANECES